jgi:hypothetical protein
MDKFTLFVEFILLLFYSLMANYFPQGKSAGTQWVNLGQSASNVPYFGILLCTTSAGTQWATLG